CRPRAPRAPSPSRTGCSPRRRAGRPSPHDAPRLRVDVDAAVADEAAEGHPPVASELDRQTRRRTDGDDDRAAGDGRFLDKLEREAAADAEDAVRQGKAALAERPADDLVERVVPADVLSQGEQLARPVEKARR